MAASCTDDILTLGIGKSSWPELVGVNREAAAAIIVRENPKVIGTVIVKEGMVVTMDFRSDRVWIWVDKN
ncbi:hypothetical protein FH972_002172 [Carpinus fangiana]|uniref:Uncharacterized protein n=1 Tax=Carpinus fangiana TaxID=176857 RepID=A0A5N6QE35_9ROSI|nr:hypothetical protein FH972_002172 [Carpinus fangiana]